MSLAVPAPAVRAPVRVRVRPEVWLLLGVAVTFFSGMRFNVAVLGWVSAVPWLVYLRQTSGWRSRLAFFGALQLAMLFSMVKIVTPPIPMIFAPMFSVPMALGSFVAFLAFEALRSRLGDRWGLVLFPAMVVFTEFLSAHGSELGSWGASAYTQLDNLPLMQLTSVFGLSGVSALLALVSALVAVLLTSERPSEWRRAALVTVSLVLAAHGFGSVRMFQAIEGPMVTVASVVTDARLANGALPEGDVLDAANDALFERTVAAAEAGAQVVVWNEGATGVAPADEPSFHERLRRASSDLGIDIVAAYVVPLDGMRHFENKYVWMTPEGPIETYHKHHPVPGEGADASSSPLVVHERPYGRAAGAICYDYDFPAMGRAHGALDADLVLVPSSDWRGIDPYHTQMASIRGIENGFSVVRPVRAATSGAYDAHGVARGLASDLEGEHLLVSRVPARRVRTIYSRLGDVLPAGSVGLLLLALVSIVRLSSARGPR